MSTTRRPNLPMRTLWVLLLAWMLAIGLFQGSYHYGMNYDEVLRLLPYVQWLEPEARPVEQSIYSFEIGDQRIPVMFKGYLSALCSVHLIPALFFPDWRFGLRFMHLLYFLLTLAAVFLYLRRIHFTLAMATVLLLAVSPYLYPEIRFGFSSTRFLLPLLTGLYCAERAWRSHKGMWWFAAGLGLGLTINIYLYSLWTLCGWALATILLFPRTVWGIARDIGLGWLWTTTGLLLGAIHIVVYNIATAGGSFRPFLQGLFQREKYNEAPIDYGKLPDFWTGVLHKLQTLWEISTVTEWQGSLLAIFLLLVLVAYLVAAARLWHQQIHFEWRPYFLPPLALVCVTTFILATPKSGRVGHWAGLVPLPELTIATAALLAYRHLFPKVSARRRQILVAVLIGAIFLVFSTASFRSVLRANQTRGGRLFTTAVYDMHRSLEQRTDDYLAVAVDWGLWSPLYFLSRGKAPLRELSFRLAGKDPERARNTLTRFILENHRSDQKLLFLFHQQPNLPNAKANFLQFVQENQVTLVYHDFRGQTGDLHYVAEVAEPTALFRRLLASATGWDPSEPPVVSNYGPRKTVAGQPFNRQPDGTSAMWFRLEQVSPFLEVFLEDEALQPIVSEASKTLTIPVAPRFLEIPGVRRIRICRALKTSCSRVVELTVLPPPTVLQHPVVLRYGPQRVYVDQPFNQQPNGRSSMWFQLQEVTADLMVRFDGRLITPVLSKDEHLATIEVDPSDLEDDGLHEIQICRGTSSSCSRTLELVIVER